MIGIRGSEGEGRFLADYVADADPVGTEVLHTWTESQSQNAEVFVTHPFLTGW